MGTGTIIHGVQVSATNLKFWLNIDIDMFNSCIFILLWADDLDHV